MTVLREGLLAGLAVALAGPPAPGLRERLTALGAQTGATAPRALVYDGRSAFGPGGASGLEAVLDGAWSAVAPLAEPLIAAAGGRLVFISPRRAAGPLAGAAAAGLENLARTLSIEWARHAITACAIVPGPDGPEAAVAELAAFLLSPAGGYHTGCRFDLA